MSDISDFQETTEEELVIQKQNEKGVIEELNILVEEVGIVWVILAGILSVYVLYRILMAFSIIPGGAVETVKKVSKEVDRRKKLSKKEE